MIEQPDGTPEWDVIVVGGGVAGLSAALMLGRARRRTLVLDDGLPRNRFAEHMHGVLGQEGVPPADLLATGRAEVAEYGVESITATVTSVQEIDGGLRVADMVGEWRTTRALIVATGVRDELPDVPGLAERWGRTVLHCPYCHGYEVADRRLGVLAASPMSIHQALLVRQWSDRVIFFAAGAGPLDDQTERRLAARDVRIVREPVEQIIGEGETILGVRTAAGTVEVDAIFTGGPLRPRDEFLAGLELARTETPMGSMLTVDPTGRTSHERIWAVGNGAPPAANVPAALGAGAMAGGVVNMFLVTEDFDRALAARD